MYIYNITLDLHHQRARILDTSPQSIDGADNRWKELRNLEAAKEFCNEVVPPPAAPHKAGGPPALTAGIVPDGECTVGSTPELTMLGQSHIELTQPLSQSHITSQTAIQPYNRQPFSHITSQTAIQPEPYNKSDSHQATDRQPSSHITSQTAIKPQTAIQPYNNNLEQPAAEICVHLLY
ncbi:hypothetical protein Pmani_017164 [Petrolisthes manimaculis]|uniref:Uncharacterized protein n=1 Tax=Petrolisthes manimaculis TaxID=1843537 RepID=A0AAE1PMY8_9EUCA|nr:hypothetical protein Pmani_017164 [Petrolisthes manimaculis]